MKLDSEMRALIASMWIDVAYAARPSRAMQLAAERTFATGYRMGLERAAKVCEESASRHARGLDDGAFNDKWKAATKCAAAIREMAHD